MDGDPCGAVWLFSGGCGGTPALAADLGRGGACRYCRNGDLSRSKSVVGFRRLPCLAGKRLRTTRFDGTDEYDPADDDHYNLPGKAPRVQILPAEKSEEARRSGDPYRAMDRGRKRLARGIERAAASGAAAAQLSGVARGGERQGCDATARGDKRPDDPAAPSGPQRITAKLVRTPDRSLGIAIFVLAMLTLLALLNAGGLRLLSASPDNNVESRKLRVESRHDNPINRPPPPGFL